MADLARDYQRDVTGEACYFCQETIEESGFGKALVHHIDHDHTNNEPENLAPAHWGCHSRHHRDKGGQVHYRVGRGHFVARKTINGCRVYVGSAQTEEEAWSLLMEERRG